MNLEFNIEGTNKFNYSTNNPSMDIMIEVVENSSIIYKTEMNIVNGVNYFTSLTSGWFDKTVNITDTNTNEKIIFKIKGIEYNLDKSEKELLEKYRKKVTYNDRTILCDIMGRNKSDKASQINQLLGHNYTRFYHDIFNNIKGSNINIFELGLGTNNSELISNMGHKGVPCASIYGWKEYFINGKIFGADIDTNSLIPLDKDSDIKTFYCDQTNKWIIKQMWDNKYLSDIEFDIIIEDGLHTFESSVTFFENSYQKLKRTGYFIIEDITFDDFVLWIQKIKEYETKFPQFKFEIIELECSHNKSDNNLIKITYQDV